MNTAHIDLTGRVALVTGASSGIGRDLCLDLARSGAKVIAGARRTDKLQTLVEEIRAAGGEAIAVTFDVCDAESIRAAFDEGEAAFGLIDTIYANAGTYVAADALSLSMEDFNHVMQTNLNGTILTAREGAQRLINTGPEQSERGRVVVTSSVRGQFPASNHLAYCTSKAATLMAGKVLAKEWALHGINVNMVCPGVIITDINMPNMDGFEFMENVRQDVDHRTTPILVLTTESKPEMKARAKSVGASGWIVKPFNEEKLVTAIRRVAG